MFITSIYRPNIIINKSVFFILLSWFILFIMNFTIQQLKIIYDSLEDKELSIIDGTYQKEVFEIKKIQVIIFNEIIKKQEIKKINKDNKKIKDEIIKEDTLYKLTSGTNEKSIVNGDSFKDSEVK